MAGIRQSKFKHVFGRPLKRDECYECIPITRSTHDTAFCAVNPKFLAIITESSGGGGFTVIPISKVGRMSNNLPMVAGHTAAVIDIQWCPHDNNIIASGSEDCTVKIWNIPEEGIGKEPLVDTVATLIGHQRRVNLVSWHPTAQWVIASSGADNVIILWDITTQRQLMSVEFPNLISCLSFNYNGSKLAASCRDGNTHIVNPRNGTIMETAICHEGKKPQMCVFIDENHLFTTGFSKMSERQLALWNVGNLEDCLWRQELDITNGVLFPFYDPDTNIIFICGKGDSTVRYFEYSADDKQVYYLSRYDSTDPQRGFAFMPKLGLNVSACEIARMYKLHNKNWCEVIPFTVPRKSGLFQEDLYPDTIAPVSVVTAQAWLNGEDAEPVKIPVRSIGLNPKLNIPPPTQPALMPSLNTNAQAQPVFGGQQSHQVQDGHIECSVAISKMSRAIDKLADQVKLLEDRVRELEGHNRREDVDDNDSDISSPVKY